MPHTNPPDEVIRQLLTDARTIALVGASANPDRPSHGIMRKLLGAGYRVIPVSPRDAEVLGQRAYTTLAEIPEPVDIVDVFRRAEDTPPIASDAVRIGAKALWLQLGITSAEAAAVAAAGGLTVVMDVCIGTAHTLLQVPKKPA
jgi:predicted CoA-binding protein